MLLRMCLFDLILCLVLALDVYNPLFWTTGMMDSVFVRDPLVMITSTPRIKFFMNSSCCWLVKLGHFSQEEVDCYNSFVLDGVFNLDCLLPDGRIYTYLDPAALCDMLEETDSFCNQLKLIVWFPNRKIEMLEEDCDDIYVSDLAHHRHLLC